ncbi:hypothetical protein [Photobacterium lipolyticum]|uniref:hypothetical protein n=1 Tax=Photobacterium lipolyticum TaxID=266810 RepID=UPI0011B201B5|nr:hypothetical protein [Photobacterium lipolyticum]
MSASLKDVGEIQANAEWVGEGKYKVTFLQIYDVAKLRAEIIKSYNSSPDFARDIRNPEARFITTAGIIFDHEWTLALWDGETNSVTEPLEILRDSKFSACNQSIAAKR